jgi:hypothetical protein
MSAGDPEHKPTEWVYPGKIVIGKKHFACMISDVSETGARVRLPASTAKLKTFILYFGVRSAMKRECIVKSQSGREVYVKFKLPNVTP